MSFPSIGNTQTQGIPDWDRGSSDSGGGAAKIEEDEEEAEKEDLEEEEEEGEEPGLYGGGGDSGTYWRKGVKDTSAEVPSDRLI